MSLPPELLYMIFAHLRPRTRIGHSTLCTLRLVNKTYNTIASDLLFTEIISYSSECAHAFDRLRFLETTPHLRTRVKEYSWRLEEFVTNPEEAQHSLYRSTDPLTAEYSPSKHGRTEKQQSQRDHYLQTLEFEESGALYSDHYSLLTRFPALKTLRLGIPDSTPLGQSRLTLLMLPFASAMNIEDVDLDKGIRNGKWGLQVWRSFLRVMGERAKAQSPDIKPIAHLSVDGFVRQCMTLAPSALQSAISGFRELLSIEIELQSCQNRTNASSNLDFWDQCWHADFGRLLQCADKLLSLKISQTDDLPVEFPVDFDELFSPPRTPSTRPVVHLDDPPSRSLPSTWHTFANLRKLEFVSVEFRSIAITTFLRQHTKLQELEMLDCSLNIEDMKRQPSQDADPDAQMIFAYNCWSVVFKCLKDHHRRLRWIWVEDAHVRTKDRTWHVHDSENGPLRMALALVSAALQETEETEDSTCNH